MNKSTKLTKAFIGAFLILTTTLAYPSSTSLLVEPQRAFKANTLAQACPYPVTTTVCDQNGCRLVTIWVWDC